MISPCFKFSRENS
ncbi:hypothetical protein YPPY58_0859, partial [Yersinia pestis PY-58]